MVRLRQHLYFAFATTWLLVAALYLPYTSIWERISVASAWICMALLCAALMIGPIYRIGGRLRQANIYIRRDIGVWAGLTGLLHFVAGNVVAMNPIYVGAFVQGAVTPPGVPVREQLFSAGAILGTLIAILLLLLLAISSDWAIRRLGSKLWKRLQRSAHFALWLTIAHGLAYQILESRYLAMLVLVFMGAVLLGIQLRARR
jgi:sulfoxide reductase heme-binding subunit YedZ